MTDMINPSHYRGDRQFEPIAVIEDWQLKNRLGNALKYISRNGRNRLVTGPAVKDSARLSGTWSARSSHCIKPSQYESSDVQYEDVLELLW